MKNRAAEDSAIRAFLRRRRGCCQEYEEHDSRETAKSEALKYVRHKIEVAIVGMHFHCSKGTYTRLRNPYDTRTTS